MWNRHTYLKFKEQSRILQYWLNSNDDPGVLAVLSHLQSGLRQAGLLVLQYIFTFEWKCYSESYFWLVAYLRQSRAGTRRLGTGTLNCRKWLSHLTVISGSCEI
jgi:hypothetical protein